MEIYATEYKQMRPPAPQRAFWRNLGHCRACKKPRPTFMMHSTHRCLACKRAADTLRQRKFRSNETTAQIEERRAKDRLRHETGPIQRARDTYSKLWKQNPYAVLGKCEDFFPIYLFAEGLAGEDPEHRYIIVHDIPLRRRKNVCGLHTPKNLKVRKLKRASSPTVRT